MATVSESRARRQAQVELAIRVLEPFLNALLFVGDRLSRVLERDDPDYVPARMPGESGAAPRGLRERPRSGGSRGGAPDARGGAPGSRGGAPGSRGGAPDETRARG